MAERMKDGDLSVELAAASSLSQIGKAAVPTLVEALQGENPRSRSWAAGALGRIGPDADSAGPALLKAIKDKNSQVSGDASAALGGIQTKKMLSLLLATLGDNDPQTRAAVISALGKFHDEAEKVVPALLVTLGHNDPQTRAAVISALGKFRDEAEKVVPALDALLLDKDTTIRERAVQAIGAIGSSRVIKFVQGAPGEFGEVAVQEIGPSSMLALDPLLRALHDDSERVRDVAAGAGRRRTAGGARAHPGAGRSGQENASPRYQDIGYHAPDFKRDDKRDDQIARRPGRGGSQSGRPERASDGA